MNQAKVKLLLEHIQQGGDLERDTLASILSVQPKSTKAIEGYLAAVEEEDEHLSDLVIGGSHFYSEGASDTDDEEDEEEEHTEGVTIPAPTPAPKKSKDGKVKYRFFLEDPETGTSVELERVVAKSQGKVVTFHRKVPKQIVKLTVRGVEVEVDLIALRLKNPSAPSDINPEISNERLLNYALIAQP